MEYPKGFYNSYKNYEIKYKELYPNIIVYNILSEHKKIYNICKYLEYKKTKKFIFSEWTKWGPFGTYAGTNGNLALDQKAVQDIRSSIVDLDLLSEFEDELFVFQELYATASASIGHYLNFYNIELPEDWFIIFPSLSRYDQNVNIRTNNEKSRTSNEFSYRLRHWRMELARRKIFNNLHYVYK